MSVALEELKRLLMDGLTDGHISNAVKYRGLGDLINKTVKSY